jgi:hypothetical protein
MTFWRARGEKILLVDMEKMEGNGIYLGFGSTLLTLLAAQKEAVVISLEVHPNIDFSYSDFLTRHGAIDSIHSFDELEILLRETDRLMKKQQQHKAKFTHYWMYKLDGQVKERLRKIVLGS